MEELEYKKFFEKLKNFKEIQTEQKAKGLNDYNILSVIRNKNEEVGLHSNLIYSLLNPNEKHNQGELFLRLFMKNVLFDKTIEFDLEKIISVKMEDPTSEQRRVDFTIESTNYLIGIEMKTTYYTEDQPKQLSHYKNELDERNEKYHNSKKVIIYYLTLNGKEASDQSIKDKNEKKIKYRKISFKKDMLNWITSCQKEVSNITNLTNLSILLSQYKDIILQISSPVSYKGNLITLDKFILTNNKKEQMLNTLFNININNMQEYKKEILKAKGQMLYEFFHSFNTNEKFDLKNINYKIKQDKKTKKLVFTKNKCMKWFQEEKSKNFGTFYELNKEYLVFIFIGKEKLHYGIVKHENYKIKDMSQDMDNSININNLQLRSWSYLKWYSKDFKLLNNLDIFLDYENSNFITEIYAYISSVKII